MLRARHTRYVLDFLFEARTSRNSLWHKPTHFVEVWDDAEPEVRGLGECNHFAGLSPESEAEFEAALEDACASGAIGASAPSGVRFGWECAVAQLRSGGKDEIFPSAWTRSHTPININGLIWMGDKQLMLKRIGEKLDRGFKCLKLKIGGIDFADELDLLGMIRKAFSPSALELRLDANGAFAPAEALARLRQLSPFGVHSIEQPIKAGQPRQMAEVCALSPIPICLDEELIGVKSEAEKEAILDVIHPHYVVLKPALCGGLSEADEWIRLAQEREICWWATSALESNVGLSAIAQWVGAKSPAMPQGLGTGALYSNNFCSPLEQKGQSLYFKGNGDCRLSASQKLWP